MGCSKSSFKRKFIVIQASFQKKEKSSIKKTPNFTPKHILKRTKPKVSRRKELIKIRIEINKIETEN